MNEQAREHYRDVGTMWDVNSERYANETIGLDGSDSEYFVEDYDEVHCVHGNFIGYAGGADFMCGLCEMGQMYPKKAKKWTISVYGTVVATVYSEEATKEWDSLIELCEKADAPCEINEEGYTWWDTEE